MYKRLTEVSSELEDLHQKGLQRGVSVGWDWSEFPFTIKIGTTTYIAAAPHQGKTEFWFEILINISCLHGWKHCIFSPETGSSHEIYAELCSKFVGQPYYGQDKMSQSDKLRAEMFVNEHFVIIDPSDEELTIEQYYKLVDQIENEQGFKFHTTTIDPWNELKEVLIAEDMGREDKYLSRILGYSRKNAKANNRHNCIINHVRDQATIVDKGIRYNPIPTARDFAGGQVWFRKGMLMGILWRPPYGLCDEEGRGYKQNQTIFKIAKSKPKGVSTNGLYNFYLDLSKYRYYMEDYEGNRVYADRGKYNFEETKKPKPPSAIKPSQEFNFEKEDKPKTVSNWKPPKVDTTPDFIDDLEKEDYF